MKEDLEIIKKLYGEKMMHLCRSLFPSILEEKGALSKILLDNFYPNRFLAEDLDVYAKEESFKNYIFSSFKKEKVEKMDMLESPEDLLSATGYNLYECKTEAEIQYFKKYYKSNEILCTFSGGRLNRCYVFFAVKKNVDQIKRENFSSPERQDEYGTSVISIQFTRDNSRTLSIKNRYNHTVANPDATYSNNLDNIKKGLTESFGSYYGMKQVYVNEFEIPNYVKANDGKYYKYNYEINNKYYCINNIIIDNFRVIDEYAKESERYILIDYFLLDRKEKKLINYDQEYKDAFIENLKNIEKIEVINVEEGKRIKIITNLKEEKDIFINKSNQIIKYFDDNIKEIGNLFLYKNTSLTQIEIPQIEEIGDDFLCNNTNLTQLKLPQVKKIGDEFLYNNTSLNQIEIPKIEEIGNDFLSNNTGLTQIKLPQVKKIGDTFLSINKRLTQIEIPQIEEIGNDFLTVNTSLTKIEIPKVKRIGSGLLNENNILPEIDLLQVEEIGGGFLSKNNIITQIDLPQVKKIGFGFLYNNNSLSQINLPQIKKIGSYFLYTNNSLQKIDLPQVEEIEDHFLARNTSLSQIVIPQIKRIGEYFLYNNNSLPKIDLPQVKEIGNNFLYNNTKINNHFLYKNHVERYMREKTENIKNR